MINGTLSGECKTSISSSNEISSDFIVLIRKPMMRNLFISAAFIEFSCRFSFMLGVLLDIRVALFMSRWLLNIRKVFFFCFFAFLRRRQSLCVIDWLLIGGEKTCLRSAPLDSWLVCPKITETRQMSMSQDRKVSPRLLSHSKMSARSG